MGNLHPRCTWPSCECADHSGPCKFTDPDHYFNKARTATKVEHPAPTASDCRWPSCGCTDKVCMFEDPWFYAKRRAGPGQGATTVVPVLTEDQRKKVSRYVKALEDNATSADVVAAHFRPEFDACWEPTKLISKGPGAKGLLVNSERAMELKDLVLEGPRAAKQDREVAAAVRLLLGEK